VGRAGLGRLVWPGMILAGLALGASVWAAWPESTTRVVRLPYGEALPKTPRETVRVETARPAKRVAATAPVVRQTQPVVVAKPEAEAEEEEGRVLAVVEPEQPSRSRGPAPVPSELELEPGYEQESPEELGAEPLPGAVVTQPPPPAAG
jgi:hypothetical protein